MYHIGRVVFVAHEGFIDALPAIATQFHRCIALPPNVINAVQRKAFIDFTNLEPCFNSLLFYISV
ncbi:MAG: hypothetical protein ACK55I_25495, partial [bacterium]